MGNKVFWGPKSALGPRRPRTPQNHFEIFSQGTRKSPRITSEKFPGAPESPGVKNIRTLLLQSKGDQIMFQKTTTNGKEVAQCDCGHLITRSNSDWHSTCPACGAGETNWTFLYGGRALDETSHNHRPNRSGPGMDNWDKVFWLAFVGWLIWLVVD